MERDWRDGAGVEAQGQEQRQTGTPDNELELIRTDRNPHWSLEKFRLNDGTLGNSLAVQWLGLQFPLQVVWVQFLVRELRSHMPRGTAKIN